MIEVSPHPLACDLVQTRPPDLDDDVVAGVIAERWRVSSPTVRYLAVGYGSHHWMVEDDHGGRWFASVDVLAPADPAASSASLEAALAVPVMVRSAGLDFVVAPLVSVEGALVHHIDSRHAVALYPRP